jgi:acetoin utilization protein AcuB
MRVKELMTREVRTIAPDRMLLEAAELMRIRGIRHLPVVERSAVVGILSNRDLAAITRRELEQVRVRDVMKPHVVTIEPESTVAQAANRMRAHAIGCLPVTEGRRLAGIITITDLLEHLGRGDHAERAHARVRKGRKQAVHG